MDAELMTKGIKAYLLVVAVVCLAAGAIAALVVGAVFRDSLHPATCVDGEPEQNRYDARCGHRLHRIVVDQGRLLCRCER